VLSLDEKFRTRYTEKYDTNMLLVHLMLRHVILILDIIGSKRIFIIILNTLCSRKYIKEPRNYLTERYKGALLTVRDLE